MTTPNALRQLPSVDKLLQQEPVQPWLAAYGREAVLGAIREALATLRQEILAGAAYDGEEALLAQVQARLGEMVRPTLRPLINATGVVLHTNLGRAPLSEETLAAMARVGRDYSNLEYDLDAGARGSRYVHAEALLCRLTGAEAALVVNNNAAAVLLMLSALAQGREVVISRGQLVEIGGGFRIPDVMAQSGAKLIEVGTTNRTYARDYAAALTPQTVALLRVHASNFRVVGFTQQAALGELVALAHERGLLLLDDLGSGTLLDTARYGLMHEPTVQESVAHGADVVTFSGDKLLGGPQAGILVGRAALIDRLRHHPLTRAMRVDKTTLAGIQANLLHYLRGEVAKIPLWRMIALTAEEIGARAQALSAALGPGCAVLPGRSAIGGGSLPEETLPTMLLALPAPSAPGGATALAARLRAGDPPVIARVQEERVLLDLRTVSPAQEPLLLARLRELVHD
jgi:L-seryl-tRNA(Ser) seleniumtransferase